MNVIKNLNDNKFSPVGNNLMNSHDEFVIPSEAACSPEFANGCFIMEDEADEFEQK